MLTYISILGYLPWGGDDGFATRAANDDAVYIVAEFSEKLAGRAFACFSAVIVCIVIFGSVFSNMAGMMYLPGAAAESGLFIEAFARRSTLGCSEGVPTLSLLALGTLSSLFCFLDLDVVVGAMTVMLTLVQFIGQGIGICALRYQIWAGRREDDPRAWKVRFLPLVVIPQLIIFSFIFVTTDSYFRDGSDPLLELSILYIFIGIAVFLGRQSYQNKWPFAQEEDPSKVTFSTAADTVNSVALRFAEEQAKHREALLRAARIELLRRQVTRRIMNTDLARGWTAWFYMWTYGKNDRRLLQKVASRVNKPELNEAFTHWRIDWKVMAKRAEEAELWSRRQLEAATAQAAEKVVKRVQQRHADVALYKTMFAAADAAKAGKVTAATSQLSRSGLSGEQLMHVWQLADVDRDGFLDLHEYALACHMITRNKKLQMALPKFTIALHLAAERFKGQPLPESIPPSWLSGAKRAALARPSPAGGYGGYGGGLLPPAPPAGGFGVAAKKKGGFFGRKSKPKAPKETKDKGKDATGAGGGFVPPTLAPPGDGFGSASGGLLPPLPAGGGSAFGFIGGNGGEPAHPGGFGGGQWGAPPLEAPGFGSIQGPMSVRLPGAPAQKPMSAPEQAADWGGMSRSGLLQCELAGKKKPRWVVLGAGSVAIYGDKKDFSDAKPPKATLDVRREVQRVMCSSMSSFAIILKEDVKAPGAKPKDKPIAKAGESIKFESEDSKELTAWVTDITAVWRAGQQF
eukprot:jgi/Chrpa1/4654/Chrysochromulina_OHIO_Genome00018070-RA